ncbi:MAG: phosphoadenylyl-sulfate reductase [Anaerolineales bacterium]|nr:phosphoadenylyl-sulfate reductase [Anaerolineales bacterium]
MLDLSTETPEIKMKFTPEEIDHLSDEFESASPQEILQWAVDTFCSNMALSSSFQTHSIPLLHMVKQIHPEMRILFLETGYHFWDTLMFREQLEQLWGLNIVDLRRDLSWNTFLQRFGKDLPETNPTLCCYIRKVQPMQIATAGLDAWITGIRRDQTDQRASAKILEIKRDGLIRVAPMLNWRRAEIDAYINHYNLPKHPLPVEQYPSVGCKPCTRAVQPGEDDRAGRWAGKGKTECGLHTDLFDKKTLSSDDFQLNIGY